jgi:hypothetical protein
MKISIVKDLVKVADSLDRKGLYKESDMVDSLIQKIAGRFDIMAGGDNPEEDDEGEPEDEQLIRFLEDKPRVLAKIIAGLSEDNMDSVLVDGKLDLSLLLEVDGVRDMVTEKMLEIAESNYIP